MKASLGLVSSQKRPSLLWPACKTHRAEVGDEPGRLDPGQVVSRLDSLLTECRFVSRGQHWVDVAFY